MDQRDVLLNKWANGLIDAARGALTGDPARPIHIRAVETIAGPRAGALEVDAGFDAERLLKVSIILLSQLIPWNFQGKPAAYQSSRYIRIEAGWPDGIAEKDIKLSDLGVHPNRSGACVLGKNEHGAAVTFTLSDNAPHVLVSGTSGSGKTVAVRSVTAQWASNGDHLVLIDGKFGEGLKHLNLLPGVQGPLARDVESARRALAWAYSEMVRRYQLSDVEKETRLIVVIDEIQELVGDPAIAEMVRRLVVQGRSAKVHVVLSTQKPVRASLGDPTIKANLMARIALLVDSPKSSEVALGQSSPRADWLLGAGDAYALVPGKVQRVQISYMPRTEIDRLLVATPRLPDWPEFNAEILGQSVSDGIYFSGEELAVSLLNALRGRNGGNGGRDALESDLRQDGLIQNRASADRLRKLLKVGRDQLHALEDRKASVCLSVDNTHTKIEKKAGNQAKGVYGANRQTARSSARRAIVAGKTEEVDREA
ncbi:MAG TPA: FtsK/SpoIIIE domain-containing protein [Anaerolineae bacterium]|nr:FtsK/SpoIIIE domain-containing protein [Anaerolineae bacterium]